MATPGVALNPQLGAPGMVTPLMGGQAPVSINPGFGAAPGKYHVMFFDVYRLSINSELNGSKTHCVFTSVLCSLFVYLPVSQTLGEPICKLYRFCIRF